MCSIRLPSRLALLALAASAFAEDEKTMPATPGPNASERAPFRSAEEFSAYAHKLRQEALEKVEPRLNVPTTTRPKAFGTWQWRQDIVTATFWVGSKATGKKGADNEASCWDPHWAKSFGGFDDPRKDARIAEANDFRPRAFEPALNPFYFALPCNDVTKNGTKPEACAVIPWFRTAFVAEGQSVLRDRWIAVRNRRNGRIAYAQWSDCGPSGADQWQYVFGNERPRPNSAGGTGLSVSPSVRDYLGLEETDVTDWRFVESREVPPGPWRKYGENNPFVQQARQAAGKGAESVPRPAVETAPRIQVR